MNKPLLGLDVDGVMYQFGQAARDALTWKFGGSEISHDVYLAPEHMTKRKWDWLWGDEAAERIFGLGSSFPGAIAAARMLASLCRVRIITKTPANGRLTRTAWLRRRGIPYDELAYVDPGSPKSAVVPHCDIYLDDSADVVDDLAMNTGAAVLLLDRKWNQLDASPRAAHTRVHNWGEVIDFVVRYRKGMQS